MTAFRNSVCFAALFAGGAAVADVSPQEVWEDWKDQLSIYGPGLTIGDEEMSGSTLTVSNIAYAMSDDEGSVKGAIASMVFTDLGDGSVAVSMSENNPMVIIIKDGGDEVTIRGSVNHEGLSMIVDGTADELHYVVQADRYGLQVDEVIADGGEIEVLAEIYLNALSGNYTSRKDNLRHISYDMQAENMTVEVHVEEPNGGGGVLSVNGEFADYTGAASVSLPLEIDLENPENVFLNGLDIDGSYSLGNSAFDFNFVDGSDAANGSFTLSGAQAAVAVDQNDVAYSTGLTGLTASVAGSDIPFPIDFTIGEYGLSFMMPLSQASGISDFALGFTLADVQVNDMIWMMADPTGALPHDAVTAKIDLSGTMKTLFDLLDPAQADMIEDSEMPFELHSLNLNNLQVTAAGAEATGNGAFTFDNTDLETYDGFPAPAGELNIRVDGANGLMDKLVAMGLMAEDDIMGARMMMGLFANAVGDDQLESKIEVTEDGHIFANGQQLK